MPKSVPHLDTTQAIRRFLAGPCTAAARTIVDEVGILNIHSDEFEESLESLQDSDAGSRVQDVIDALMQADGPLQPHAMRAMGDALSEAHLTRLADASHRSYLLGLMVGRQAGGQR